MPKIKVFRVRDRGWDTYFTIFGGIDLILPGYFIEKFKDQLEIENAKSD